jgi:hypothetical protein
VALATLLSAWSGGVAAADAPFAGLRADDVTSFTATIGLTTGETVAARAAWGYDRPAVWSESDAPGTTHRFTIAGLQPNRLYTVWPQLLQQGDPVTGAPIRFRTGGYPQSPAVSTTDGVLRVDGQPFLPVLAYNACDPELSQSVRIGIDVLVSSARSCGGTPQRSLDTQLQTAQQRAFVVGNVEEQGQHAPDPLLGWYQVDEPDGRRQPASELPSLARANRAGKATFLTLTGHFFADPFPWAGPDWYRDYVAAADVVGYDYYPLQGLCSRSKLPLVYAGQVALTQLAEGKPTFQWIEANRMEKSCRAQPQLQITPAVLRNEVWQALAGGARGIGFFPVGWTRRRIPDAIAGITRQLASLAPALLSPVEPMAVTQGPDGQIVASARTLNDARYLIVVNARFAPATATVQLTPDDATREWTALLGPALPTVAADGKAAVSLPPLAVGVYVAAPQW